VKYLDNSIAISTNFYPIPFPLLLVHLACLGLRVHSFHSRHFLPDYSVELSRSDSVREDDFNIASLLSYLALVAAG